VLIDEIEVSIKAGHGGVGKVSFGPGLRSGPDGGNGGKGGDVYALGVNNLFILKRYLQLKACSAEDGKAGGKNQKTGAGGEDFDLIVPKGSSLSDIDTEKVFEVEKEGQRILLAKGGLGGKGNYELRSPTNTTPKYAQPGLPGQKRNLKIILRLLADIGLIGLPNAGKSSLLNALTNARAKTASYPFTTLEPNLGDLNGKIIADIPGLIEGASEGRGLGIKFLKHIEKVTLLIHCLSLEADDLAKDYQVVLDELKRFNPQLLRKEQIVVLTKTDLVTEKELGKRIRTFKKTNAHVFPTSTYDPDSFEKLKKFLSTFSYPAVET